LLLKQDKETTIIMEKFDINSYIKLAGECFSPFKSTRENKLTRLKFQQIYFTSINSVCLPFLKICFICLIFPLFMDYFAFLSFNNVGILSFLEISLSFHIVGTIIIPFSLASWGLNSGPTP
jgi:hypothetical protein